MKADVNKTVTAAYEDEKLKYRAKEDAVYVCYDCLQDVIKIGTAAGEDVVQKLSILKEESHEFNLFPRTLIDCRGLRSPSLESAKWIQLSRTLPKASGADNDSSYQLPAPHPECVGLFQQNLLLLHQDHSSMRKLFALSHCGSGGALASTRDSPGQ